MTCMFIYTFTQETVWENLKVYVNPSNRWGTFECSSVCIAILLKSYDKNPNSITWKRLCDGTESLCALIIFLDPERQLIPVWLSKMFFFFYQAAESGYGSESSLRKGGSMLSLSSVTSLSTTASSSSFKVLLILGVMGCYCYLVTFIFTMVTESKRRVVMYIMIS